MERSKEEIKEDLLCTIDNYYAECKLPPMAINSQNISDLMDILEAHFLVHNLMYDYEYALNVIIRRALYFSQRENDYAFNIEHLLIALKDLSAYHIPSDEINAMQEELLDKNIKSIKIKLRK